MVIKCISNKPTTEQKKLLPLVYSKSDFHITKDQHYIVLGISFLFHKTEGRWSVVEIISDYGHLSHVPLFLFEVVDARVSKFWRIKIYDEYEITLWPELFYQEYFHDDLSENRVDLVREFAFVRRLIENEAQDQSNLEVDRDIQDNSI